MQSETPIVRDTRLEERKRLYLRPTYLTESPDTQYDTGTWEPIFLFNNKQEINIYGRMWICRYKKKNDKETE